MAERSGGAGATRAGRQGGGAADRVARRRDHHGLGGPGLDDRCVDHVRRDLDAGDEIALLDDLAIEHREHLQRVEAIDALKIGDLHTRRNKPKDAIDVTGPVQLQQGDRVLLCSDGLWSSIEDDRIVHELSAKPVAESVPDLVEGALRSGGESSDNVTVIAFEWETPDTFESTHGISTDSIMDGVFASTIQAGVLDTLVDDLDDAAIERSIAEINEAIRRSAAKKA